MWVLGSVGGGGGLRMGRAEDGAGWIKMGAVGLLGARLPGFPNLAVGIAARV